MTSRLRAVGAMLLLLCVFMLPLLAAPAAWAQAQPATAAPNQQELEELIATLEDEGRRKVLLGQLRNLLEVQRGEEEPVPPSARLVSGLSARVEALSGQVAGAIAALADAPRAYAWVQAQVTDPAQRYAWGRLLLELVLVLAAGYLGRLVVQRLIQRPRTSLGARDPAGLFTKLTVLALRTLLDLLPVVTFGVAGFGVLAITQPDQAVRLAAITFLNASVAVQVILVAAVALLSPAQPRLRLLPVGSETAYYLKIWVRRISLTGIYGFFIAQAALLLGLPQDAYGAVLTLVGLIVAAMLVILVLQNRRPVAGWLRGDRVVVDEGADDRALVAALSGTATVTEAAGPVDGAAPAAAAAAAPGTPAPDPVGAGIDPITGRTVPPEGTPDSQRRARAMQAARNRLADIWHILTILYIVAIFGIWALRIEGGFEFITRATLITLVVLVLARYVGLGVDRLIRRAFAVAPELKEQHPLLEQRANRYLPILHKVLKGAVWLVAALVILQAWGIDSLVWLGTPLGQRVSAALMSVTLIIVLALIAWELVSGLIERYLTATEVGGKKVERSARMRTLLPLLRNAFMVLLLTLVSLMILSEVGLNIAPLLAGAGVIGLAIGFGAQTLVKDIITGLFILVEDTISVGDVVNVGGTGGLVEAIGIRTIRLRDVSGTVHTIPYSDVTKVSNLTKEFSFYVFDVGVSYREDTDQVVEVLKEIGAELQADPEYGPCILEPLEINGVDAFRDSAVIIRARFKTRPIKQWFVGREFNRRMKKRFDELGIEIPFPHQTIYFGTDKHGRAPAARFALEGGDTALALGAAAGEGGRQG